MDSIWRNETSDLLPARPNYSNGFVRPACAAMNVDQDSGNVTSLLAHVPDCRLPDRDPRRTHTTSHATTGPPVSLLDLRAAAAEGQVVVSVGAASCVICPPVGQEARVGEAADERMSYSPKTACSRAFCSRRVKAG